MSSPLSPQKSPPAASHGVPRHSRVHSDPPTAATLAGVVSLQPFAPAGAPGVAGAAAVPPFAGTRHLHLPPAAVTAPQPAAAGSGSEEGFIVVGGRGGAGGLQPPPAPSTSPSGQTPTRRRNLTITAPDVAVPTTPLLAAFDSRTRVTNDYLSALGQGSQAAVVAELGRLSTCVASGSLGVEPTAPGAAGLLSLLSPADVVAARAGTGTAATTVADLDRMQTDMAQLAYSHALALYLKAARLFELALHTAHDALRALNALHQSAAPSTTAAGPGDGAAAAAAVAAAGPTAPAATPDSALRQQVLSVCHWLKTCLDQCCSVAQACLRHVDDTSPPVCAEELLYRRAMQVGRAAVVLESTSTDMVRCKELYGEAVTLLRLLSTSTDRPLQGSGAAAVVWFREAFDARFTALQAVLSPVTSSPASGFGAESPATFAAKATHQQRPPLPASPPTWGPTLNDGSPTSTPPFARAPFVPQDRKAPAAAAAAAAASAIVAATGSAAPATAAEHLASTAALREGLGLGVRDSNKPSPKSAESDPGGAFNPFN